ncbi:MAG: DUF4097 family beta strand repeat protein [Pirellulales bacterium]|nr:DUF4097 family beta strand repeat protein [Pirellulales bacterium]
MKPAFHPWLHALILLSLLTLPCCNLQFPLEATSGGYRFDRRGQTANRHEEGEISPEIEHILLTHQFGDIRIEATDDGPSWSWDLTCWASTQETAEHFAKQIQMQTDQQAGEGGWTLVLPEPPVPELRGVESNLTLHVPATVDVEVSNGFGQTEIVGVRGGTLVRCRHGKLHLANLGGELDAATSFASLSAEQIPGGKLANQHGSIRATDVGGDLHVESEFKDIEVRRVSGSLVARNAHGKITAEGVEQGADVRTSFNSIELGEVEGEVLVRNRHGDIFASDLHGNVDLENEYGDVELVIDAGEVRCRNRFGRVTLSLTGSQPAVVRAETAFDDIQVNVFGAAEPKIEARTKYGRIQSQYPVYTLDTGSDNFEGLPADTTRLTLVNKHGDIRIDKVKDAADR